MTGVEIPLVFFSPMTGTLKEQREGSVCVRVCVCVRACVRVCVRVSVTECKKLMHKALKVCLTIKEKSKLVTLWSWHGRHYRPRRLQRISNTEQHL